jgi:hypothetical protein
VQLAAADEHRADLRQLAGLAGLAVGLRVDDDKLGARKRLFEQLHPVILPRAHDGMHGALHRDARPPTGAGGSLLIMHAHADGRVR